MTTFLDPFSEEVWKTTYKDYKDTTVDDTFRRVAKAIASVEETDEKKTEWEEKFYDMLSDFKVTPGGRILSNAGTDFKGTSLINCYVLPREKYNIDSMDGILNDLRSQTLTLKSEGGVGQNFSYIRPRGAMIHDVGVETPGAVKFMELFDKSSDVITAGSGRKATNKKAKGKIRKGAQMAVLDCWHPDVIEFITAKQQPGRLTKFNVSVNCTDEFMNKLNAVYCAQKEKKTQNVIDELDKWELQFPDTQHEKYRTEWDGDLKEWKQKGYSVITYNTVKVTWLWDLIMKSTYTRNEPGVLFLDRSNYFNPGNYFEKIMAVNPCITGQALVSTEKGLIEFQELYNRNLKGEKIKVLTNTLNEQNDTEFLDVQKVVNSGTKPTITVHYSNGMELTLTPDHKLYTVDGRWVEAKDSVHKKFKLITNHKFGTDYNFNFQFQPSYVGKNHRLYDTKLPTCWTEDLALLTGWLVGDGWITNNGIGVIFGKDDTDMLHTVERIFKSWEVYPSRVVDSHQSTTLYIQSKIIKELFQKIGVKKDKAGKKRVPLSIFQAPKSIVAAFLRGLFSADGSVLNMNNGNFWISLASVSRQLLNDVQQLLLMYNITHHSVYRINRKSVFEYTNKLNEKVFYVGDHYNDLRIFGKGIVSFYENIGFSLPRKQQKLANLQSKKFKHKEHIVEVTEITDAGNCEVYDLTQSDYHNFIVNGVTAHNCGEQQLAPANVCCLGSLNLTQFVTDQTTGFQYDKIQKYVTYLVRFLDNVDTYSYTPLSQYKESMLTKRRIGIGIMGWGSALLMLKIRYGSDQSEQVREKLMKLIAQSAYIASIELAEEKGRFSLCDPEKHIDAVFIKNLELPKKYLDKLKVTGIRNSSLLSIQPTGNTSVMANVVSGGCEPIFMGEYIRTVIVNAMPEHIADVTPKWYEGAWHETSMFKKAKEGDEEILRGVDEHGIVYKIDKNRGLTKEVLCQDYGVRHLKEKDMWDANAAWAVTTNELTVEDHIRELKGFAKFIDSAISKTINLPHDYPYEDFKNIYLEAYKTGYIKGLTTYRANTMTSVLSSVENHSDQKSEEIIKEDVQLPDSSPASVKILQAEGKKWYVTVVYYENNKQPFALFVQTNAHEKNVVAEEAVDVLTKLARKKGIPKRHIDSTLEKITSDNNPTKVARLLSLLLRHGVLIKNIVAALDKVESAYVGTFVYAVKKFLGTYVKDGEVVKDVNCTTCGGSLIFQSGCTTCSQCGNSKCG